MWITVNTNDTHEEILHVSRSNSLQVCLVKTGTSIPFINTLELRPLVDDIYPTESSSLNYYFRAYFSDSSRNVEYPDDVYDRIWRPLSPNKEWALLTTNLQVNTSNGYDLPQRVMAKAVTPVNASTTTLEIPWTLKPPTSLFYVYLHFAELQTLQANETREFDVTMNGNVTHASYSPKFLKMQTAFSRAPKQCDGGKCLLQLVKTSRSTLPPLINAIEIFTVIDFSQLETHEDEVVAIKNIQSTYGLSRINWQGDPCVPKKFLWDGLNCNNSDVLMPPTITSLNLSSSGLTGIIALTIQNLTKLQELDLSNNNLTGGVPEFLADMKSLLVINLRGNNLSGIVPQKLLEKKMLKLNIEGNPKLHCTVGLCVNKDGEGGKQKNSITIPIVASVAAVVALIVALVIFYVIRKKAPLNATDGRSSEPTIMTKNKKFTYSEVITMTNNFQKILGKGGFGTVYYGSVNSKTQVAVKMLSHSSSQGYKQFKAEVELLLRVHHKNLVGLVGYCEEGDKLALIYEYMANGDLDGHMSGKRGGAILNWGTRLKIAVESAQGLEYLHNYCEPVMVHRDVKTTNILLNEDFDTKLADFGLSRSFPIEGETHVSTVVAGTIGYLDPEYYRTNWLTEKSDVYSFGIVLLVLITNQPVIEQNRQKSHIAEWVGAMLTKGDIKSITDPNLHGDYDTSTVWKAVELAMSCLNPASVTRPTMSQVVVELKECLASESSRGGESPSREVIMTFGTEVNPTAR
ncbi:probable LRR receptor-like serine/threonine-protein kinase At1g51810 isoform X3 [Eutrema salsugineum]|uniref:probable LRR receptor-like serine/threonine-protein kinase At1g51810 isoform X3 n=1 Tax=Eutrema salsugineum TaxID=72664 RepID=UPI000CED0192|nr:probable LRR receptor-like serine/threonine-protein kinase At1g51810 isoform X3 [Eutrema salsugineum]